MDSAMLIRRTISISTKLSIDSITIYSNTWKDSTIVNSPREQLRTIMW